MEISILKGIEPLCMKISGRLDASNSSDFEQKINEVYKNGNINIIFDLSELSYISSAGLRVFMLVLNNCKESGKKVVLVSPNEIVAEVFIISGLSNMIPAFPDMQNAIEFVS